jgi:hypothetical protein
MQYQVKYSSVFFKVRMKEMKNINVNQENVQDESQNNIRNRLL